MNDNRLGLDKITAVVLAGGKSKRMGQDKAMLEFLGQTMLSRVLRELEKVFDKILIVSGEKEKYTDMGYEVIRDKYPNCGPLGGIQAALERVDTPYILVVACDMPLVNKKAIELLLNEAKGDFEVLILERKSQPEPLFAIYSKDCLPYLEASLQKKLCGVIKFISGLKKVKKVRWENIEDSYFLNVNTMEEMKEAQKALGVIGRKKI